MCPVPATSGGASNPVCGTPPDADCCASAEEQSSLKQVAAAALILGQNVTKTAEALGIDRRTVQRWSKFDPEFHRAMADTKQEVVVVSRQSLLALAESAVEMVETKLAGEKNPRLAMALLRGVGALTSEPLLPPVAQEETESENRAQSATFAHPTENGSPADQTAAETENENRAQSATLTNPTAAATEPPAAYELADLLPEQQRAAAGLFAGKTVAEVAELVSTSEDTVRGWLCHEVGFFTVLSEMQFGRIAHLKYRLLKLLDRAVEIVRQGIAAGDGRLALALVRGMGLLQ
jgi:predicted transcriptional regulator